MQKFVWRGDFVCLPVYNAIFGTLSVFVAKIPGFGSILSLYIILCNKMQFRYLSTMVIFFYKKLDILYEVVKCYILWLSLHPMKGTAIVSNFLPF